MNDVDSSFQSPATLSLCTGGGGLDRGVERAIGPLRTIIYVEIEAFAVENLLEGMEKGVLAAAPVWPNLKTLPWEHLRHRIFLLLGGYPCQPFSTAGKRQGKADPRHLWPYIERGVRTTRPVCCFFENVAGHLSLGFEQVADSLRAMGYAVEAGIYTAEEVGAPHKRARLFILAILADAKDSVRGLYERSRQPGETEGDTIRTSASVADTRGPEWRPDNSGGCGCDEEHLRQRDKEATGFTECCQNVVDSDSGSESGAGRRSKQTRRPESTDAGMVDGIMAYTGCERLAEREEQSARQECHAIDRSCRIDRWPARPGEPQQAWESPRLISRAAESSLGISAHGYHFREDLLRLAGNGVVEEQAEFAIIDLLRKHFEKSA
jgi:DNA (cytosine-5)-methyltransferase 1